MKTADKALGANASRLQEILSEDIPAALHYIDSGTVKFQTLIDTMLALSRYGRQEYETEEVDLNLPLESSLPSLSVAIAKAVATVLCKPVENVIPFRHPERPAQLEIGVEPSDASRENISSIFDSSVIHCWVRENLSAAKT